MRVRTTATQLVLELAGELDISTCPAITDALAQGLTDPEITSVVFDLKNVTFMDSSAIKCVVHALQRMRIREGSVTVCNAQPNAARLIKILGLDSAVQLVEVFGDAPTTNHDQHFEPRGREGVSPRVATG